MGQVAVFVDAGYLFVTGAEAITGERKVSRERIWLDREATVSTLRQFGKEVAPGSELLRVYWYDGLGSGGPTGPQLALAYTAERKMRFGILVESVNGFRQKGVDTLLVTDIIELARNRAMSDAIVLSGDEDVRSGVQIAQSYGIRVHLLGIAPSAENQSNLLRQEADTVSEWGRDQLAELMSVDSTTHHQPIRVPELIEGSGIAEPDEWVSRVAWSTIETLTTEQLLTVSRLTDSEGIPPQLDRILLGTCKRTVGTLNSKQKWAVRREFKQAARQALETGTDPDELP